MKLTPIDIAHKSFQKKMMGLAQEEVYEFLQDIAQVMEALIHERNSLKEALREKDLMLAEYKERDQVLKNTIATATQMADRMRGDAEREAKLIITDAQQKAEIITRDSRDSLKKTYSDINELKKARMQFEANLKALVQAHLGLLEQGEKYLPQMQMPQMTMQEFGPRSTGISPLSAE